jgi:hypothetical protein
MSEFVSVIFCRRCSSRYVEIKEWNDKTAIVYCRSCGNSTELKGFTLGRCQVSNKELGTARNTSAGVNDFVK